MALIQTCTLSHCGGLYAGHVAVVLPVDDEYRPSTTTDAACKPTSGFLMVDLPMCQRHLDVLGVDTLAAAIPHRFTGKASHNIPARDDQATVAGASAIPAPMPPRLGEEVLYRPRVVDYWLAAKINRTVHSSSPEAVERAQEQGRFFIQPLGLFQVDLTVFTPGGSYVEGEPSQWTGTYAEHHISYDRDGAPGTWCRFEDVWVRGVRL